MIVVLGLPEPLYGAGAVRVRTGFVVCGGIGKGGKPSNKVDTKKTEKESKVGGN